MSKREPLPFHALIPAAGNGSRMGLSTPKQYCKIGGKMILRHTIEKFLPLQGLISLRVIINPDHRDLYNEAVAGLNLPEPVTGAGTRKQSVNAGLDCFDADDKNYVLIHDAARPFVSHQALHDLLNTLQTSDAATLAAPIADTLIDTKYNRLNRDHIRAVQTPQAFRISLLKKAHAAFEKNEDFTDDAGIVTAFGTTVELVTSGSENFKITTAEDLIMAERILASTMETRTGMGFDVHAFAPEDSTHIRLGGIDIPHAKKMLGHSDADVVLHALTDAILGAINEGDIGKLFPPSDIQWKGADSEIFLKEAANRVAAKGGKITFADITIICEAPKIGPHREAMQTRIAAILGLPESRISIKATTTESLGFTGRREGIACQAVANITLPSQD